MLEYLKLWGCRKKNVGVQEEKRGGAGRRSLLTILESPLNSTKNVMGFCFLHPHN